MNDYQSTNPLLQPYRDINVRLIIMDYKFNTLDELSGMAESMSLSNDSTSDIRRTVSIDMVLDSGYTNTGVLNDMYFSAGNGFWFDKYISVEVGIQNNVTEGEVVYYPQGVYLINEPSVTYDATTNTLSFSAIDLMAKLTGLRAGNLQGIQYQIPAGSVITDVIRDILQEQGFYRYVLNSPETPEVPYDIKIESGGTTYQLLSELRDINPNWEMFFDVNGTFVFQKIPSGSIDNNPTYDPTTVATDEEWDKLLINYQLSTSFEDVKNYIEVYGKTIEPTAEGVVDRTNIDLGELTITASETTIAGELVDFVLFVLGDTTLDPIMLETQVNVIKLIDSTGEPTTIYCQPYLKYDNMAYILRVGNGYCEYCGYQQPVAIAWEDNPNSPFYVGESQYKTTYGIVTSDSDAIVNENGFQLSAIKSGEYLNYDTPTDEAVTVSNLFTNMVRHVCSGDEYDNIYSNQLAIDRAVYELYQRCRLHDTITIQCVPLYQLDSNQMISITLPNEDEISYWLIKSISTEFSATGTQTITAMKYYAEYPAN